MVDTAAELTKLKQWRQDEFIPWQQAMENYNNKQLRIQQMVRQYAPAFKAIIAFLLDGQPEEAVKLWNNIGISPVLKQINIMSKDELALVTETGQQKIVRLDDLLADLQKLLK